MQFDYIRAVGRPYWWSRAPGARIVFSKLHSSLYDISYASPREFVWLVEVNIQLMIILTAFIGYVLPLGQMSLWGEQ